MQRTAYYRLAYTAFAIILLIACWETNLASAAALNTGIPQESIRLRIVANSDTIRDQWIKREVKRAVTDEMNSWVAKPQSIEEAREAVQSHLPELDQAIAQVLQRNHFDYTFQAELESTPFPTKMFGERVYPAADYEALLITLGEAQGQNWWCVLFPPLCFVDAVQAKEPEQSEKPEQSKTEPVEKTVTAEKPEKAVKLGTVEKAGKSSQAESVRQPSEEKEVSLKQASAHTEIHFFLWDMMLKLVSFIKGEPA
ncbi:MAG: stage sporulation protein [Paenibacillaceae bacterium]|nr:stage sporulation protein [Paenibacillaceae bacterium]